MVASKARRSAATRSGGTSALVATGRASDATLQTKSKITFCSAVAASSLSSGTSG